MPVVNVVIDDIDLLRETTHVTARYEVPESSPWPTPVESSDAGAVPA